MRLDPDALTILSGFLGIAGFGMAMVSLYMKRRIAQIDRQLEELRGEDSATHFSREWERSGSKFGLIKLRRSREEREKPTRKRAAKT